MDRFKVRVLIFNAGHKSSVSSLEDRRVRLSPEGLLGELDDVGRRLHVDVVIMQSGRVSGGAGLSQ